MSLREYQEECIDLMIEEEKGIIILPTGAGKTVIFSSYASRLSDDKRLLIVVDQDELYEQTVEKLVMWGTPESHIGRVQGLANEVDKRVVIATRQSLTRAGSSRPKDILSHGAIDTIIIDECHLAVEQQIKIYEAFHPKKLFGFTATPFTKNLNVLYTKCLYEKDIFYMIENGYLSEPKTISVKSDTDLSSVGTNSKTNDFNEKQLSRTINTGARNKIVVEAYQKFALDRNRTIIFASNIAHCISLVKAFKRYNIDAVGIHSNTPNRKEIIEDFRNGKIKVIINVGILTKGFDCPEVDCIIIASPTKSKNAYIQKIGRGLRIAEGKLNCLIIDIVDAYKCSNSRLMDSSLIFNTQNGETYSEMLERIKQEEVIKQEEKRIKDGDLNEDEKVLEKKKDELELDLVEDEDEFDLDSEDGLSGYKLINLQKMMEQESDFDFNGSLKKYDLTLEEIQNVSDELGVSAILLMKAISKAEKNNFKWVEHNEKLNGKYKIISIRVDRYNNGYFILANPKKQDKFRGGVAFKVTEDGNKIEQLYGTKSHLVILKAVIEMDIVKSYKEHKYALKHYYETSLKTQKPTQRQIDFISKETKGKLNVKTLIEALEYFMFRACKNLLYNNGFLK